MKVSNLFHCMSACTERHVSITWNFTERILYSLPAYAICKRRSASRDLTYINMLKPNTTIAMSTIIASNIPVSVDQSKVKEFFSFCGKIDSIVEQDQESEGKKAYQVKFASVGAVSTALLLNGAELGGGEVNVIQVGTDKALPLAEALPSYESAGNDEDIDQEEKPKSAILAQYLSQGYVLSDQLIDKALAFDKTHGYSEKFKNFVTSLDQKYHVQEKTTASAEEADSKFNLTENYNKGKMSLSDYYDKFKQDKYGSKIHQFYSGLVSDTKAVHDEARRLADLKEEKEKGKTSDV